MTARSGRAILLHPGDVAFGLRGDQLKTILGSCVSIVLTDPRRTVGAMCHIVHAQPRGREAMASGAWSDVALELMCRGLRDRGLAAHLCEAYVYGGGNMFPNVDNTPAIGDRNVDWALQALQSLGVRVIAADVRGTVYRRLRWTVGPDAPEVTATSLGEETCPSRSTW